MQRRTMKLIVFFLVLLFNLKSNGNASSDTDEVEVEDGSENTVATNGTTCNTPCSSDSKPRRCHFIFDISPTINTHGHPEISINGQSPGPSIIVCLNDIVSVEVHNRVSDQSLAIHWHGIEQKDSPHMDGVPMVTQCPIEYGSSFTYYFRASLPGTHFYHADSVIHQSDGIYGALIIKQPYQSEVNALNMDLDIHEEHTILISAAFNRLLTGQLDDVSIVKPNYLTINGDVELYKIIVKKDFGYRLRMINAIGMECPVVFYIKGHEMTAIAADGRPVKPVVSKYFMLYPGERLDVVIVANQPKHFYEMKVNGISGVCVGLEAIANVVYDGYFVTSRMVLSHKKQEPDPIDFENVLSGQYMKSVNDIEVEVDSIRSIYLGIDKAKSRLNAIDNFQYVSDAHVEKPYYPTPMELQGGGVVQINGKNFLYPNAPLLLSPHQLDKDKVCRVGEEFKQNQPQCIHVLPLKYDEVVELVLLNEGYNSDESFTFHMHGQGMEVLATYVNPHQTPISKSFFLEMHQSGNIIRNTLNPPIKDTVSVPNKGFVIVKIREHLGTWLLECRACSVYSVPAAIIVRSAQMLPKSLIQVQPRCGTYKPPDTLMTSWQV